MTTTPNPVPDDAEGINAIAELAVGAGQPYIVDDAGGDVAVVYWAPNGEPRVVDLQKIRDQHRHPLDRKSGTYTVTDVESFLTYYGKHAENDAEVWVDTTGAEAVLNAYGPTLGELGWRPEDHRVRLALTASPEWKRWSAVSGKLYPQDQFAEWLEGAARDIVDPDFATVLEVAQSLEATSKVEFRSAYRTADGQRAFRYEETTNAKAGQKGELEIPTRFLVSLRPFGGQEPVDVEARFRYRIQAESLQLGIVIDRIPEILEAAVESIRVDIASGIDRGIVLSA